MRLRLEYRSMSHELKGLVWSTVQKPLREIRRAVPLGVWQRLFPRDVLAFMYHMVSSRSVPHVKHYSYINETQFESDIVFMEEHLGFITYAELFQRRFGNRRVCDNRALPTFDDGFSECATVANPILQRHRAPCIFFLITDLLDNKTMFWESKVALCIGVIGRLAMETIELIVQETGIAPMLCPIAEKQRAGDHSCFNSVGLDSQTNVRLWPLMLWLLTIAPADFPLLDRLCERLHIDSAVYLAEVQPYMTTQQVHQLVEDGCTIGAHSRRHVVSLQDLSAVEAEAEIVQSCAIVRDLTGQKSVPFAFPWSGSGLDRAWLAEIRRRHGFIGLYFDTGGFSRDASHMVHRISCDRPPETDPLYLQHVLRGLWNNRKAWHWTS